MTEIVRRSAQVIVRRFRTGSVNEICTWHCYLNGERMQLDPVNIRIGDGDCRVLRVGNILDHNRVSTSLDGLRKWWINRRGLWLQMLFNLVSWWLTFPNETVAPKRTSTTTMSVLFDEEFVSLSPTVRAATPGAAGRPRSEIDLETGLLSRLITYKYKVYLKMLVTTASCI